MKVTFVSNYINHHQIPFCDAMYAGNRDFSFVQTEPMEEERIKMGWGADKESLKYLHLFYEEEVFCRKLIEESDVVLFGGVDEESYIQKRLRDKKIVVRLSERIYKSGQWKMISPRGLIQKYKDHTCHRKDPVYLLCCGAYVASDFHLVRAYPEKMFKWGYFPECREQNIEALLAAKRARRDAEGRVSLIWAGRFIDWKHPEFAILAGERLKKDGIDFKITMVGGGAMEEALKTMVKEKKLSDKVEFVGFKKPEEVRRYMENSDIHLFTSDYMEGWGAVLNESMNSGCAPVCDCGPGAVPFLYEGNNMCIYPCRNFEKFYEELTNLIQNPDRMEKMGRNAYFTIHDRWNAKVAAERLQGFLEGIMKGSILPQKQGILSPAKVIAPGKMYRYLQNTSKI